MRSRSFLAGLAALFWLSACGRSGLPELVGSNGSSGGVSTGAGSAGTSGGSSGSSGGTSSRGTTGGSGTGATLQGAGSFVPNSTFAYAGPSGCYDPTFPNGGSASVYINQSTPAFQDCLWLGFPPTGGITFERVVAIKLIGTSGPTFNGTYELTNDPNRLANPDAGAVASLTLSGPTSTPPIWDLGPIASAAVGGTVTLTASCAPHFAGIFSATMSDGDGGQSQLTGSFDTPMICGPI